MSNEQILAKVIKKATGADPAAPHFTHPLESMRWNDTGRYWYEPGHERETRISLFEIIFQHSFAKALWGEEVFDPYEDGGEAESPFYAVCDDVYTCCSHSGPLWLINLRAMAVSDDPIEYLRDWIEGH